MKTRIQKLFIALAWLALPALVQAQFTFTTNNGAITITGYNTAAGLVVVIPAATNGYPVTSIGDYAFQNEHNITSVTIPNSVTSIGNFAFADCTSLTSVTIPNSVTNIGVGAFGDCTSLTSVTIPNSVTNIGSGAFQSSGITNVTIPNSVTSIGLAAFDCTSLTSINVDAANPAYSSMNGVLFDKAKATLLQFPGGLGGSYTIPSSVTSIGSGAFESCTSLVSVTIGNNVISVGNYAFENCTSLTSVTIPNSVTSIGDFAFYGCPSLTSVTIPNSVTSIGIFEFASCASLTSINVDASNPAYSSLSGVLFDKAQATLVEYPGGLGGSYTIPNSVTTIGYYAFIDCTNLTSVTIPNSVTSIGDYAFYLCTSLTSAYFLGNAPPDNNGGAFLQSPATVYYLAGTSGWGAMFGGVPSVLWNPQANTFSFTGGQFEFNLTGPTNTVIVVEACTNLSHPVWLPVSTNTLSGLGTSAFSDPTGYPMRYYRFRSP